MANPFPKLTWVDSEHFDKTYLMWQPNEDLGILVTTEENDPEPIVIFCSLFESPDRVFYEGRDKRSAGLPLSKLIEAVDAIRKKTSQTDDV